jgi:Tol biopolymer transport system component
MRRAATIAGLTVLVVISIAATATAAPKNGPLAFTSASLNPPRDPDVRTVKPKGGRVRNLTKDPSDDYAPDYSPSGSRIVYAGTAHGQGELFMMRSDGNHRRQLTHSPMPEFEPAFSPDGKTIVFSRRIEGRTYRLFSMDLSHGRRITRLTHGEAQDGRPSFSPDGRHIVFDRYSKDLLGGGAIMTIKSNGHGLRKLVKPQPTRSFYDPEYSPRSGRIFFSGYERHEGNSDLFTIRPSGHHFRQLTKTADVDEAAVTFSPDGKRIAFTSVSHTCSHNCSNLFVSAPDGSHRIRVTGPSDGAVDSVTWGRR